MEYPIRILHVVTKMDLGGIETFLMTLYRSIDRQLIQFDFLVHREEEGFFDNEIKQLGGILIRIRPLNPKSYSEYKRDFNRIIRNNKYTIIHAHLNANSSIVLNLAKRMGLRTRIAHSHIDKTTGGIKGVLKSISKIFINNFATHRFACSAQAGNWLFGSRVHFQVLTNAIDSSKFVFDPKKRVEIRGILGVENENIVIGNIARFNIQKNHTFILKIFTAFHKKNPSSKLLLLGEGELKEDIENTVKRLNLTDAVIFTGALGNANEYLNAMDLFIFPSLFEGLGIVAVEAQTNGLPVVLNEKLPNELDMTNLIVRLSLDDPLERWVSTMENALIKNIERRSRQFDIQQKGYDVISNAKFLEDFYVDQNKI